MAANQLIALCVAEPIETDLITTSEMMSPIEEQPQYIYATNGYVDQTGAAPPPPPPVYYINGESVCSCPNLNIAVRVWVRVGCPLS